MTGTLSFTPSFQHHGPGFRAMGLLGRFPKNLLTVICYHRVLSADDHRFKGYKPVISASRDNFIKQIDHLRTYYNPISLRDLVAWLDEGVPLPPRPALISFDDGYRDNAEVAWPIMRDRGVPAVIFLATDHIGTGTPFIWDLAAYCFSTTAKNHMEVPLIGRMSLVTVHERDAATVVWVEAAKRLPGSVRVDAINELMAALCVPAPPESAFRHLYLDWSDVLILAREGVEFGAHTRSHPILTSLPVNEAADEIEVSIERLTKILGSTPLGFAYPNGSGQDYSPDHEQVVQRSGVPLAFSLEPGPMSFSEVRRRRMAIRRVYVGEQDSLPRFIAKLMGAARIGDLLRAAGP
jgi:peptidoglycan/xylan/chitin deacetylase (PgdA/CDA1 family)